MSFQITIADSAPCIKSVTATIDPATVNKSFDRITAQVAGKAKMPGFRAGKAPAALVAAQHGKQINLEVQNDLARLAFGQIMNGQEIDIASQPEVEYFEVKRGAAAEILFSVEVFPEFTLPDYKAIKIETTPFVLDQADVEEALGGIAQRYASLEKVETPAKAGDFVRVDFSSDLDKEVARDLAGGQGRFFNLSDKNMIPGVMEAFTGKKTGDSVTWTCDFPADFAIPGLQGKSAKFEATVLEVHSRTTPPIDDALAKLAKFETLAELRQSIEQGLKFQFESNQRGELKESIIDQLLQGFDVAIPPRLLETEIQRNLAAHSHQHDHSHEHGDCAADAREKSIRDLKSRIILRRIAKLEQVQITNEDISAQLINIAKMYKVEPQALFQQLKSAGTFAEFQEHVLLDKTLDALIEKSTATA